MPIPAYDGPTAYTRNWRNAARAVSDQFASYPAAAK
jgi:hypothetical protein